MGVRGFSHNEQREREESGARGVIGENRGSSCVPWAVAKWYAVGLQGSEVWVEQQLLQSQFLGSSNNNNMPQHATCNMLHGNALCRKTTRRQLELFLVPIFFLFPTSHLLLLLLLCRHIPKAKATAIADTPELKRIAENTKIQSNVKYHADFEKTKGKFTQVSMPRPPQPPLPATHTPLYSCVDRWQTTRKRCASSKTRSTYRMWHIMGIWRKRPPWRSNVDPLKSPTAAVSSVPPLPLYISLSLCVLSFLSDYLSVSITLSSEL